MPNFQIPENQEAIDWLVEKFFKEEEPQVLSGPVTLTLEDEEIIEKCRLAKNASKFSNLFDDGDISLYDNDESRADQALASILAFYTDDPDQLERIFRQSALMREKWERADYRERTFEVAFRRAASYSGAKRRATNTPKTNEIKAEVEVFAEQPVPPPIEFLVGTLIPKGHLTLLYGDGGSAKSTLALSLGLAVARGAKQWMDHAITDPGEVLYLDFELNSATQQRRASEISAADGERIHSCFKYLSALSCDRPPDAFVKALKACEEQHTKLLIIDSLGPAFDGDANEFRAAIDFFMERIRPFLNLGVSVAAIDHQSKLQQGESYQNKRAFGSIYKSNMSRSVIQIENTSSEDNQLTLTLRQNKSSFSPLSKPFSAQVKFSAEHIAIWREELDKYALSEEASIPPHKRVLYALQQDEMSVAGISSYTGIPARKVEKIVYRMVDLGKATFIGSKVALS